MDPVENNDGRTPLGNLTNTTNSGNCWYTYEYELTLDQQ